MRYSRLLTLINQLSYLIQEFKTKVYTLGGHIFKKNNVICDSGPLH